MASATGVAPRAEEVAEGEIAPHRENRGDDDGEGDLTAANAALACGALGRITASSMGAMFHEGSCPPLSSRA